MPETAEKVLHAYECNGYTIVAESPEDVLKELEEMGEDIEGSVPTQLSDDKYLNITFETKYDMPNPLPKDAFVEIDDEEDENSGCAVRALVRDWIVANGPDELCNEHY